MATWLTADTHLGQHVKHVGQLRNQFSPEDWYEMILGNINGFVERKDRLIVVGDFCHDREVHKWRQKIRCKNIYLIRGNHDASLAKLKAVVGQHNAHDSMLTKIGGLKCFLHHYPTLYWDGSHRGYGHCCGHTHDQRTQTIADAFPGIRCLDVGPDSAVEVLGSWRPFHENEVAEILLARPGHDPVSWYKERQEAFVRSR